MKLDETLKKFELYIVSLWLLFFLIIVVTADIPICFGENCTFIGFSSFFQKILSLYSHCYFYWLAYFHT